MERYDRYAELLDWLSDIKLIAEERWFAFLMGIVKLTGLDENRWQGGPVNPWTFFTPKWEGLAVRVHAIFSPYPGICDKHPIPETTKTIHFETISKPTSAQILLH